MRKRRKSLWIAGGLAIFILLLTIAVPVLFQEPLRRHIESRINESLEGYSVRLGGIGFRPVSTLTLHDLRIFKDEHPEPAIADIPLLRASLHWRAILNARLVADFEIDNPKLHINLLQIREEMEDETPADEKGWQEAVHAIYPFKINMLTIRNGNLLYIDADPDQPLRLDDFFFEASNIRNIESPEASYPSPFRLESIIFEEGSLLVDGHADFLRHPYPGVSARVEVAGIPIDPLRPVLSRYNFFIREGEFAASGHIEHSPQAKHYQFDSVAIRDIHIDYRYTGPANEANEKDEAAAAKEAVTADSPDQAGKDEILYVIKDLKVTGIVGLVNTETDPQYRIFLEPFELQVDGLSNNPRMGEIRAEVTGNFMGSGQTSIVGNLRPEKTGPDFDLNVTIKDTHMPSMNDLLMAYGGFDVTEGMFSLVMEISVENQQIDGYVEPFFRDMTVLDPDEDKDFLQQLYEGAVEVLTSILENVPRDEVATRAEITGELDDPDTSTLQIVANLIRNAFFDAILPQFEEDAEE